MTHPLPRGQTQVHNLPTAGSTRCEWRANCCQDMTNGRSSVRTTARSAIREDQWVTPDVSPARPEKSLEGDRGAGGLQGLLRLLSRSLVSLLNDRLGGG